MNAARVFGCWSIFFSWVLSVVDGQGRGVERFLTFAGVEWNYARCLRL